MSLRRSFIEFRKKNGKKLMKRLTIYPEKFPEKIRPVYNKNVSKKETLDEWIQGFMEGVKEHPSRYRARGIREIEFRVGKTSIMKKVRK